MAEHDSSPQEPTQHSPAQPDYAKEFEAVQAVVTAEIAENAKHADANRLTKADLKAIKF